jgi:hypothetical protein
MQKLDFEIDMPQLRRAWGVIDQLFFSHGLTLHQGSDFVVLEELAEEARLRPLEGHFTPVLNTYTPSQAFWLGLIDPEGNLVGRVCARFDRMEYPMTLTDFWRKYFHRCYPNADGGQVVLAGKQPRVGRRITGDVAYLGGTEVAVHWKGEKLGALLNQMAQIVALDQWRASFFYGWVQGHTFMDGFWRDCGFTKAHFNSINWENPLPETLDANLIFVGNSADDVCDLIDRIVDGSQAALSGRTRAHDLQRF